MSGYRIRVRAGLGLDMDPPAIWFMFRLYLDGSKSKFGMKPPRVQ